MDEGGNDVQKDAAEDVEAGVGIVDCEAVGDTRTAVVAEKDYWLLGGGGRRLGP